MSNHITYGIYPNCDYKMNIVRDEDLQNHIQYNTIFRPGRTLIVDGKIIYKGIGSPSDEWLDNFIKEHSKKEINTRFPTIPYQ